MDKLATRAVAVDLREIKCTTPFGFLMNNDPVWAMLTNSYLIVIPNKLVLKFHHIS